MKKYALYIVVACTILLSACRGEHQRPFVQYRDFPTTKALRSEVIRLDTVLFRYPFRITVMDSIVMILDLHNADYFMHAFTFPGGEHISSFGKRGQGPDEMLSAQSFHFNSLDSIWVLDANKMQIARWELSPSTGLAQRNEIVSIDNDLNLVLDFYPVKAGFFVNNFLGNARYHQLNSKGNPVASAGSIPSQKEYKDAIRPALAMAWRSYIDYNREKDILVMATQLGEVLEIYNLKDSTHRVLVGEYGDPQFEVEEGEYIPTGIMGFTDLKVTDNYIYTVFHGIWFKDKMASYEKGVKPEDGGRFIYVFDLEGKPVCKYTLDRAINGIAVDEENGIILATDVNRDEPIIMFRM